MRKNECKCGCMRRHHEDGIGYCFDKFDEGHDCNGFDPKYPELQDKKGERMKEEELICYMNGCNKKRRAFRAYCDKHYLQIHKKVNG